MKNLLLCVPGQKQMDQKSLDGWIWKIGWPLLYPKSYKKLEEQNFHLPARFSPIYKFHIVASDTGVKAHTILWTARHHLAISLPVPLREKSRNLFLPPHISKKKEDWGTQLMFTCHLEISESGLGLKGGCISLEHNPNETKNWFISQAGS